jgi:hypothetical protein
MVVGTVSSRRIFSSLVGGGRWVVSTVIWELEEYCGKTVIETNKNVPLRFEILKRNGDSTVRGARLDLFVPYKK